MANPEILKRGSRILFVPFCSKLAKKYVQKQRFRLAEATNLSLLNILNGNFLFIDEWSWVILMFSLLMVQFFVMYAVHLIYTTTTYCFFLRHHLPENGLYLFEVMSRYAHNVVVICIETCIVNFCSVLIKNTFSWHVHSLCAWYWPIFLILSPVFVVTRHYQLITKTKEPLEANIYWIKYDFFTKFDIYTFLIHKKIL